MKNIVFIVLPYLQHRGAIPSSKLRSFSAFPYGLLSIATYAKNNATKLNKIEIIDFNTISDGNYFYSVQRKLKELNPDIVGISMMFDNSYFHLEEITKQVKEYRDDIVVVLGGAATVPSYKTILNEQEYIDAICFSEGEIPFLKLIESDDHKAFLESDNSWITRNSLKAGKIPAKSYIQNLDDVIDIDYSFININDYNMKESFSPFSGSKPNPKQFFIITTRGCPYKCAFCMRSEDNDRSMRFASVDKIIEHVRFLVEKYGMSVLTFYDDQLLLKRKRAKQLFKELAQFNLRVECPNGLSVAFIDEEMAFLMSEAGIDTVNLAIESGSKYVLDKIIDKPLNLGGVKDVIDNLRKYGIWSYGSFVVGFPGERDEHRDETIQFINDIGLDWSGFCHAVPYRGTKLYNICVENGYINEDIGIGDFDSSNYFINTPEYSSEYITKKVYLMNLYANFVNNYRMKIGDYETAAKAFKEVIKLYSDHAFAYYYLAKAQQYLNDEKEFSVESMRRFKEIINRRTEWKKYATYFGIDTDQDIPLAV